MWIIGAELSFSPITTYEASGDSLNVDEFIEAGERYGIVTANDSIMLSAENVSILDSILPYLINVIDDMKTQCWH